MTTDKRFNKLMALLLTFVVISTGLGISQWGLDKAYGDTGDGKIVVSFEMYDAASKQTAILKEPTAVEYSGTDTGLDILKKVIGESNIIGTSYITGFIIDGTTYNSENFPNYYWGFYENNTPSNVGAAEYKPKDGDVYRVIFTELDSSQLSYYPLLPNDMDGLFWAYSLCSDTVKKTDANVLIQSNGPEQSQINSMTTNLASTQDKYYISVDGRTQNVDTSTSPYTCTPRLTSDKVKAAPGEEVKITVHSIAGKELVKDTLKANNITLNSTSESDVFSFTMPAENVVVTADFTESSKCDLENIVFSMDEAGTEIVNMTPDFDKATTAYRIVVTYDQLPKNTSKLYTTVTLPEGASAKMYYMMDYEGTMIESPGPALTSGTATGHRASNIVSDYTNGQNHAIKVTGKDGSEKKYTFNITRLLTLNALSIQADSSAVALDKAFSPTIFEYTAAIPDSAVSVDISASIFDFDKASVYINGKEAGKDEKINVPTTGDSTIVTIKTNNDSDEESIYTLTLNKEGKINAEKKLNQINTVMDSVAAYLTEDEESRVLDWWTTTGLEVFKGLKPETTYKISDKQKQNLVDNTVESAAGAVVGSGVSSTENASSNTLMNAVNLLSSLGYDPTDLISSDSKKINAVDKLASVDVKLASEQWYLTLAPYALLACNQGDFKTDSAEKANIDYLLENFDETSGGWSTKWGLDTTAMVLQGLAPYYNKNADVKDVIDQAVVTLSSKQKATGSYGSINTDAMVVIALCQLGINPDTDTRFIKSGKSLVDGILSYYKENSKTFGNLMATKQGFLALTTAYKVMTTDKSYNPYDFSSVKKVQAVATGGTSTIDPIVPPDPVTPPSEDDITVTLSIRGDSEYWVTNKKITLKKDATVYDAFAKTISDEHMSAVGAEAGYVKSITNSSGKKLSEFDKGPNSGWVYNVNGQLPNLGLTSYRVKNGDVILWYYTSDWTKDPSVETGTDSGTTETVKKDVSTSLSAVITGAKASVSVTTEQLDNLVGDAVKNSSDKIILAIGNTEKAEEIDMSLPKILVANIPAKTNASLEITTDLGNISLDKNALMRITTQATGDTIDVTIKNISPGAVLPQVETTAKAVSVEIKSGNKDITDFASGKATINIPVSAALENKTPAMAYVNENGEIVKVTGKVVTINGNKYYQAEINKTGTYILADEADINKKIASDKTEKIKTGVKNTTISAKSSAGKRSITVSWTKSKGYKVDGYRVYRATKKNGVYKLIKVTTKKRYKNTSLKKGKRYYYKVRGFRELDGKTVYTKYSKLAYRKAK